MKELNTDGGCATTIGALCTILQSIAPGARIVLFQTLTETVFEVECGSRLEASKFSSAARGAIIGVMIALSGSQEHTYTLKVV